MAFVLDLGGAVPSAIDDLVSEIVENFAAAMIDPAKFGGVRTSPKSFRRQVVLPTLELGPRVEGIATRLLWKSLIATADGLFLGGPVSLLSDPAGTRSASGPRPSAFRAARSSPPTVAVSSAGRATLRATCG